MTIKDSQGFLGLHLAGARGMKSVAVKGIAEPGSYKLFIKDVVTEVQKEQEESPDEFWIDYWNELADQNIRGVTVDAPTKLPVCVDCSLFQKITPCPTVRKCQHPEVLWHQRFSLPDPPPPSLLYVQRSAEVWLKSIYPDFWESRESLGSNEAPLWARWQYLGRHCPFLVSEGIPRFTVKLLAHGLSWRPSVVQGLRDSKTGVANREELLRFCVARGWLFIQEEILQLLSVQSTCFEAAILCWLSFLNDRGLTLDDSLESSVWTSGRIIAPDPKKVRDALYL